MKLVSLKKKKNEISINIHDGEQFSVETITERKSNKMKLQPRITAATDAYS